MITRETWESCDQRFIVDCESVASTWNWKQVEVDDASFDDDDAQSAAADKTPICQLLTKNG